MKLYVAVSIGPLWKRKEAKMSNRKKETQAKKDETTKPTASTSTEKKPYFIHNLNALNKRTLFSKIV